jgi:hypothetical protein
LEDEEGFFFFLDGVGAETSVGLAVERRARGRILATDGEAMGPEELMPSSSSIGE